VELRVADRDMAGDAFRKAESCKDAKGRRKLQLAMRALLRHVAERNGDRQLAPDRLRNLPVMEFSLAHRVLLTH